MNSDESYSNKILTDLYSKKGTVNCILSPLSIIMQLACIFLEHIVVLICLWFKGDAVFMAQVQHT